MPFGSGSVAWAFKYTQVPVGSFFGGAASKTGPLVCQPLPGNPLHGPKSHICGSLGRKSKRLVCGNGSQLGIPNVSPNSPPVEPPPAYPPIENPTLDPNSSAQPKGGVL